MERFFVETKLGYRLSLRLFCAENPSSVVIIAGAMGVVQGCYEKFARFLCAQGLSVITFDYVGTGESLETHLRDCPINISDWADSDCCAVIDFARRAYPTLKIQWVGHSVGGQLLGMMAQANQLHRAITVASGSGYWRENSAPTKRMVWLLWYVIAPLSVALFGYFPGTRLKMVGDLPPNVMRQWRRWCLHPEYAVGIEGDNLRARFASVEVPITSIIFSDDEMMSTRSIESLHKFFMGTVLSTLRIKPADVGESKIGHLGWFRERYRESLWAGTLLPLLTIEESPV